MVEILIDRKYCVEHLNEKILKYFQWVKQYFNSPNFKILCNSNYICELLNVFEDPLEGQQVQTIIHIVSSDIQGSTKNINLERASKSLQILGGSGGMLPQENFENLGVIYSILVKFYCDAIEY